MINTTMILSITVKCPDPSCNKNHLGETGKRTIERMADHCSKDNQ